MIPFRPVPDCFIPFFGIGRGSLFGYDLRGLHRSRRLHEAQPFDRAGNGRVLRKQKPDRTRREQSLHELLVRPVSFHAAFVVVTPASS